MLVRIIRKVRLTNSSSRFAVNVARLFQEEGQEERHLLFPDLASVVRWAYKNVENPSFLIGRNGEFQY